MRFSFASGKMGVMGPFRDVGRQFALPDYIAAEALPGRVEARIGRLGRLGRHSGCAGARFVPSTR
jgi:hypothetical protein